jgi:hypothetical protein
MHAHHFIPIFLCVLSSMAVAQTKDQMAIDSILTGIYRGWTVEALRNYIDSNATFFSGNFFGPLESVLILRNTTRARTPGVERVLRSTIDLDGRTAIVRSVTNWTSDSDQLGYLYTFVFRKSRRTWKIIHMHSTVSKGENSLSQ